MVVYTIYPRKRKLKSSSKGKNVIPRSVIGDKIGYMREKGLENESYRKLILDSIKRHGSLTKPEINKLVGDILPANLSENQKRNRIDNLLRRLREDGLIINTKYGSSSKWQLKK